jgi:thiosulfate/3-mercaptopyruvate sulfurtransferase
VATPLVSVSDLADALAGPDRADAHAGPDRADAPTGPQIVVLDVRWDLAQGARRDLFAAGHIPSAVFIDLAAELAGRPAPGGIGGRHPLPDPVSFVAAMRAAGVSDDRAVVVYDGTGGLSAARAWWLLRDYGHRDVAVLDGGLDAWTSAGQPLELGAGDAPKPGDFSGRPGMMPILDAGGAAWLARHGMLLDARAAERFRGESEPVDPVAGHIPGARSRPTTTNLAPDGRFLSRSQLRSEFAGAGAGAGAGVGDAAGDGAVTGVYCGSGVTAAHQVLALEVAGLAAALYPGSWSDWVSDPARPVATGD